MSNGPIAYYCYEYPPDIKAQRKQFGAKVFFVRSQLIDGHIKLETKLYKDYAWMARSVNRKYTSLAALLINYSLERKWLSISTQVWRK